MSKYEDMLHLSRPVSRHPRMRREERAKLFAPFAALSGHETAVHAREQVLQDQEVMASCAQELINSEMIRQRIMRVITSI